MTDLLARKATLRRLVLAQRSRLADADRATAGAASARRLPSVPEIDRARAIVGFASFGAEIPTDAVLAWVLSSSRRLLLPYVDGETLRAAEVRSIDELAPGYRGIREPARRTAVDPNEADVVLVPGVAFDAHGRRLGYGGGFYDAFLSGIDRPVTRVGLCYDFQIVDEVPAGDEDEPVDVVVTPDRVVRADKP